MCSPPRAGRFAQRGDADAVAAAQLDALRLPQRLHAGAGSGRGLAPGFAFNLTQHPDYSDGPQGLSGQRFVPLVVEHVAANNLSTSAATAVASGTGIVAMLEVE